MITEKKLINDFNSFWNSLLPTMTQLVFRVNKKAVKYRPPVKLLSEQDIRGLVNETAFNISLSRNESLNSGNNFIVIKKLINEQKLKLGIKLNK